MLDIKILISTKAMALFLLLTLSLAILGAIFIRPHEFPKSRINVFISILAALTVLFIGLSLLTSTLTFEQQEEINRASFTKEAIDKLWLYPNQVLVNSTHARTEFLKSLYYNNPNLYALPQTTEPQTARSVLEEQNIAIIFIQAWEDFTTLRKLDQTGDAVWLNNFLQWAQSSYLKEYFDILKYNFKETTIELGNLLFEYAKTLPIPTTDPDLYQSTVQRLLKDPRTIELLNKASGS